jgi:hypothetical protein
VGTDGPTNGRTDQRTDRPTDQRTNAVSYRGATSRLKRLYTVHKTEWHGHPLFIEFLIQLLFLIPIVFWILYRTNIHGRMARGGHELPKVSLGPTMPDPSTPCGQAICFTSFPRPFQGWPTCRTGGLRLSSTLLGTPRRTPMHKFTSKFKS